MCLCLCVHVCERVLLLSQNSSCLFNLDGGPYFHDLAPHQHQQESGPESLNHSNYFQPVFTSCELKQHAAWGEAWRHTLTGSAMFLCHTVCGWVAGLYQTEDAELRGRGCEISTLVSCRFPHSDGERFIFLKRVSKWDTPAEGRSGSGKTTLMFLLATYLTNLWTDFNETWRRNAHLQLINF